MSESPRMLQGSAVAWDTSFCVSLKEYAPVANGKQHPSGSSHEGPLQIRVDIDYY